MLSGCGVVTSILPPESEICVTIYEDDNVRVDICASVINKRTGEITYQAPTFIPGTDYTKKPAQVVKSTKPNAPGSRVRPYLDTPLPTTPPDFISSQE